MKRSLHPVKNALCLPILFGVAMLSFVSAFAAEKPSSAPSEAPKVEVPTEAPPTHVKYHAGKDVNFEELLIQGQLRRPEISVVTGNVQQGADGLLRLRENFTDRIQMDAGEEL